MASESKKTVLVAMGANLTIAGAKLAGALISGSSALLAEAAHSVSDTMNEVFLLISLTMGRRRPDEEHPFGYGRERFFWAFMAAVFIFVAGATFSVYEGVHGLVSGGDDSLTNLGVSYGVLAIAFLAEGTSFLRAVRQLRTDRPLPTGSERPTESDQQRGGVLLGARQSKDPTVKTVIFEDGAALTGLLIAFAGLFLYQLTGQTRWDSIASILIGCLLAYVAVALGRDIRKLLLGVAADPASRRLLRGVLDEFDEVDTVLELLTMHLSPDELLVAVRMDLKDSISGAEVEQVSNRIEHALRAAVPMVREVFLDATPKPGKAGSEPSQQHRGVEAGGAP